jgi:hypothetical protein
MFKDCFWWLSVVISFWQVFESVAVLFVLLGA